MNLHLDVENLTTIFQMIQRIFRESAGNNHVRALVLTGSGDFFSSGNDYIRNFSSPEDSLLNTMVALEWVFHKLTDQLTSVINWRIFGYFSDLVKELICHPKILIAIVNGPAIGIGATILGLFDMVYASDTVILINNYSLHWFLINLLYFSHRLTSWRHFVSFV